MPKKSLYKLRVDTVIPVKTTFVCWCVPDHEQTTYKVFHRRGVGTSSGRCRLSALRTYIIMVWPTELDFFGFITFTNPSSSCPKSYISHIIIDIFLYLWFSLVGMIISQLEHVYISSRFKRSRLPHTNLKTSLSFDSSSLPGLTWKGQLASVYFFNFS